MSIPSFLLRPTNAQWSEKDTFHLTFPKADASELIKCFMVFRVNHVCKTVNSVHV